jgi:putative nucleotidyltransferase with HDIG domain
MHLLTRATQLKDDAADPSPRRRRIREALARGVRRLLTPKLVRILHWAAEVLLLAAVVAGAVLFSRSTEWHPVLLVGLLLMLAFFGELFSVELSEGQLSASLVAIVLAMGLLGPAPAAACGIAAMIHRSAKKRLRVTTALSNLAAFAAVPFAGGLMVRALAGDVHGAHNLHMTRSVVFGLIVLGVFVATLGLNFILVGVEERLDEGRSLVRQVREFLPLLPGELAAGALAAILAVAYTNSGLPVLFASMALLLIFQHLTVALVRSEDRAEKLETRSRQLVGLQLGILRTLARVLGTRDHTTRRHGAAVACYAKALATELGCSEAERDVVHTAGLLHEIGKFTWPDRVLHAEVVQKEDLAIVRNHPQEGALIVGALDGYGEVADAILYHHERVDGGGYPAGLIGKEIPMASRMLAICSTYDAMTAREGYRAQMPPEEAMVELRHASANGQLDSELVESFLALLEREGPTFAKDADFETELEFERRVKDMAEPRSGEPASRPRRSGRLRPRRRIRAPA